MSTTQAGAYVQAWVWVYNPSHDASAENEGRDYTEEEYRALAREEWHKDGEIEVDEDAKVSISEVDG